MTNPRPAAREAAQFYISDDYISHTDSRRSMREKLYGAVKRYMTREKLSVIKKYAGLKNPSLLDYGCGTGEFVLAASRSGLSAFGYEPGEKAAKRAKEKGAVLITGQEMIKKPRLYDVISMWHVMEHIHDFLKVLGELENSLKNNGVIVVALPVADSLDARIYREHWAAWDLPRHLWHFTRESLAKAINNTGLHITAKHPMPFDSYYISLLSEGYRGKGPASAALLAFLNGSLSNISAMLGRTPWSSEIFVLRKK